VVVKKASQAVKNLKILLNRSLCPYLIRTIRISPLAVIGRGSDPAAHIETRSL
jgi:hypothetical protein